MEVVNMIKSLYTEITNKIQWLFIGRRREKYENK